MMMAGMRPIRAVLILTAVLLGLTGAFVAGTLFGLGAEPSGDFPAGMVIDAKSGFRKALGLQKAWASTSKDLSGSEAQPCPTDALIIVTGGQSNASNAISTPLDADPASRAYSFFDGRCYQLRDPLPGTTGTRGSVWSRLAPALSRATGRPVVFVNGAIGGSQYSDWLDPSSPYMGNLRDRVAAAANAIGPADIVLWHQGETDAWSRPTQAEIQPDIEKVTSTILSTFALKPTAKLVLYRVSLCTGERRKTSDLPLLAAQTAVARGNPRIVEGPNTDLLGRRFRHDDCHMNDAGAKAMAEQTLALIAPMLIRQHPAPTKP